MLKFLLQAPERCQLHNPVWTQELLVSQENQRRSAHVFIFPIPIHAFASRFMATLTQSIASNQTIFCSRHMLRTASRAKLGITAIQFPFFPRAVPRCPASHVPSKIIQTTAGMLWILISAKPYGFAGMTISILRMGRITSANPQNSRKEMEVYVL